MAIQDKFTVFPGLLCVAPRLVLVTVVTAGTYLHVRFLGQLEDPQLAFSVPRQRQPQNRD